MGQAESADEQLRPVDSDASMQPGACGSGDDNMPKPVHMPETSTPFRARPDSESDKASTSLDSVSDLCRSETDRVLHGEELPAFSGGAVMALTPRRGAFRMMSGPGAPCPLGEEPAVPYDGQHCEGSFRQVHSPRVFSAPLVATPRSQSVSRGIDGVPMVSPRPYRALLSSEREWDDADFGLANWQLDKASAEWDPQGYKGPRHIAKRLDGRNTRSCILTDPAALLRIFNEPVEDASATPTVKG